MPAVLYNFLSQHCNWDKDLGMETDWSCMFTIKISVHHPTVKSPIPYSTTVNKAPYHIDGCHDWKNLSLTSIYVHQPTMLVHFCAEKFHTARWSVADTRQCHKCLHDDALGIHRCFMWDYRGWHRGDYKYSDTSDNRTLVHGD